MSENNNETIDIESEIIIDLSNQYQGINSNIASMAAGCSKPDIPSFLDVGGNIDGLMNTVQSAEKSLINNMNKVSNVLTNAIDILKENDEVNMLDFFTDFEIDILLSGIGNNRGIDYNYSWAGAVLGLAKSYWMPENFNNYVFHPSVIPTEKIQEAVEKRILLLNPSMDFSNYVFIDDYTYINGKNVHFLRVLHKSDDPSDTNGYEEAELELYNMATACVINTLRTLPPSFTECIDDNNNLIIFGSDSDLHGFNIVKTQGQEGTVLGYHLPDNNPSNIDGTIVLNTNYSVRNDTQNYLVNVAGIIHELAHKFDDSLNGVGNGCATVIGNELHEEWYNYQKEYYNKITGINTDGYSEGALALEVNTQEFFAECVKLYFTKGDAFKAICPPVYEAISKQLGGDYGDAYNKNINAVLGKSN